MDCKVTLSNGSAGVFTAEGNYEIANGGFKLDYCLDGDGCLLVYDGCALTQERRGETPMKLIFKENALTECTLGGGGLIGSFGVFTREIKVFYDESGIKIRLIYDCAGESVLLEITAIKK